MSQLEANLSLNRIRRNCENDDQRRYNQGTSNEGNYSDAATASGELSPDHPVLSLEVAMVADQENQESNTDERRA